MAVQRLVRLQERGDQRLESGVWQELAAEPAFWRLVEENVLRVEAPSAQSAHLRAGGYVGRATIGDITVEIHPKIEGSLAALLPYATHGAFQVRRAPAPAEELNELTGLLVEQLVDAITSYVSRGRDFRYSSRQETGSLVSGKIDMTRTMRLRARGLGHQVAFDRQVLDYSLDKNRLLLAALIEVERIEKTVSLPPSVKQRTRRLSQLFSDCRDIQVLFGQRAKLADRAAQLAAESDDPSEQDLLSLAAAVLGHLAPSLDSGGPGSVPRSWFLSLERLFEDALLNLLRDCASAPGHCFEISHGREAPKPVLPDEPDQFSAEPDVVVHVDRGPTLIGDVKYKDWTTRPAHADLYQLLSHAAAYDAETAFLLYPSDQYQRINLGPSATGCGVRLFSVNVGDLPRGIGETLLDLRVPAAGTPATAA